MNCFTQEKRLVKPRLPVRKFARIPKRAKAFGLTLGKALPTAVTVKILVDVIYLLLGLK